MAMLFGLVLWIGWGGRSWAESEAPHHADISLSVGLGGAPFLALAPGAKTTTPLTTPLLLRLRRDDLIWLELEFSLVAPYGAGVNLLFDIVRTQDFRLHIIDPGVFSNTIKPVTVARVSNNRALDFTFGLGAEYRLTPELAVSFDARWFSPNPWRTTLDYGNFAVPIFHEVLVGVQLWLGLSFRLH